MPGPFPRATHDRFNLHFPQSVGLMIPGMWSGWLQELIGYQHFFVWVILATIPSFLVVLLIPLEREFGRKGKSP